MKIRGGQLLARALQEKGVDQVFTLCGRSSVSVW
jgi:thiamine pyrophosphate-dependent acetolactate synthase large subunit-like protein